ncbi:MAG: FAD-binding protein, partial [Persicimonas sp.]
MTERRVDIAIIGGGLAGHTAAATLADAGADFAMVYPPSPGATALWSGLGSIFGPFTELPEPSVGQFGARATLAHTLDTDREIRFERLARRRPRHPYLLLGLERAEVAAETASALESLAYPAWRLLDDERVVPAADATPFAPDLAARSVAASALRRDETVGVVDGASVVGWRAERLAT